MAKKKKSVPAKVQAYQRLFNSKDGRTVLADLAKQYHLLTPMFSPKVTDHQSLMVMDGQRSVVITILKILKININELTTMLEQEESYDEYDDSSY